MATHRSGSPIDRRQFLQGTTVVCLSAMSRRTLAAEADAPRVVPRRVVVGVMGLSRGKALAKVFAGQDQVELRYLCDADQVRIDAALGELTVKDPPAGGSAQTPRGVQDFRRILDDPEVDALICAAPNHWHAPATILACQAGKHVYVEKPCCHNPWEGETMVAVAHAQQRVVQLGTQRRSSSGTRLAMERLHHGAIGRVYLAEASYRADRGTIGQGKLADVPASLDYDLWQGPAPRRPYVDNLVHYNWHWRWHWGNGELGNNGVHTLDLCRWGLGVTVPRRVVSTGGRFAFKDDQETPDTHTVGFEFDSDQTITWQGLSCNRHRDDFVNFYGTQGTLTLDAGGNFRVFDAQDKLVEDHQGSSSGETQHIANFLAAVRSGNRAELNAEITEGHLSTLLCHLGNISQRVGRTLQCEATTGRIERDDEAMALWRREYAAGWEPRV